MELFSIPNGNINVQPPDLETKGGSFIKIKHIYSTTAILIIPIYPSETKIHIKTSIGGFPILVVNG